MPSPPTATPDSSTQAPSRLGATISTPIHFVGTPSDSTSTLKSLRAILESQQLAMLVNTYNIHFEQYSNGRKKKVTQIIPYAVWKKVYAMYILAYPNNTLQEETLKERLRDFLKEVKTGRSNPDGGLSACLQSNEVLEQLKQTDGHASRNVLKRRQDIIDGAPRKAPGRKTHDVHSPISTTTIASASFIGMTTHGEKESVPSAHSDIVEGGSKQLTKGECLTAQARSMMAMTKILGDSSEARDNLLAARHRISHAKATSIEISNIKQAVEMGVISQEEGKNKVAELLEMK